MVAQQIYTVVTYAPCGHSVSLLHGRAPDGWSPAAIREERRRAKALPCSDCLRDRGRPCERCGEWVKSIYVGGEVGKRAEYVCRACLIAQGHTPFEPSSPATVPVSISAGRTEAPFAASIAAGGLPQCGDVPPAAPCGEVRDGGE